MISWKCGVAHCDDIDPHYHNGERTKVHVGITRIPAGCFLSTCRDDKPHVHSYTGKTYLDAWRETSDSIGLHANCGGSVYKVRTANPERFEYMCGKGCPVTSMELELTTELKKEMVNHPQHYGGDTTYEVIKVLKAWLTPEEYRGFLRGNYIKYLARAGRKGDPLEDLEKAKWYLDRHNQLLREKVSSVQEEVSRSPKVREGG